MGKSKQACQVTTRVNVSIVWDEFDGTLYIDGNMYDGMSIPLEDRATALRTVREALEEYGLSNFYQALPPLWLEGGGG